MTTEADLLEALHQNPDDDATWLVLSDWLEESGQPERGELTRLRVSLRKAPRGSRPKLERRQRELLGAGVRPCVPLRRVPGGMTFSLIQSGEFLMGSTRSETGRWPDEGPRHLVRISQPFYLGVYPVTRAQWSALAGTTPGRFTEPDQPVSSVSWFQGRLFAETLSERTGLRFRLPTEAEWEYACRAGTTTPFYTGQGKKALQRAGWVACGDARPVGQKEPNAWGLFDMHGNVLEWCEDWFDENYYEISPHVDPPGPASGERRVERGGCYGHQTRHCRSAFRRGSLPDYLHDGTGFRLVLTWDSYSSAPVQRESSDRSVTESSLAGMTHSLVSAPPKVPGEVSGESPAPPS
jgi:uncharacterized protein (TIGR02996 family)